jgi:hypothetical protein
MGDCGLDSCGKGLVAGICELLNEGSDSKVLEISWLTGRPLASQETLSFMVLEMVHV